MALDFLVWTPIDRVVSFNVASLFTLDARVLSRSQAHHSWLRRRSNLVWRSYVDAAWETVRLQVWRHVLCFLDTGHLISWSVGLFQSFTSDALSSIQMWLENAIFISKGKERWHRRRVIRHDLHVLICSIIDLTNYHPTAFLQMWWLYETLTQMCFWDFAWTARAHWQIRA